MSTRRLARALGWVNARGASVPSELGIGIGITTDRFGFRGSKPVARALTPDIFRIACSGDSFTLGYGVDDAHAWCARLASELPHTETMHLGQAAYGLDQAWLWYQRDGLPIAHQLQVFALTDVRLSRAFETDNGGRNKPSIAFRDGKLRVNGLPVAPQSYKELNRAYSTRLIRRLRFVQWLRRFPRFDGTRVRTASIAAQWPAVEAVFGELAAAHRARGSELLIVYLPTAEDITPRPNDARRGLEAATAARLGVLFLDLTPALRSLPKDSQYVAFLQNVPSGFAPAIAGHYSNIGNAWVSQALSQCIRELPVYERVTGVRPGARR